MALTGWAKFVDITIDGTQITGALTNFAFPLLLSTSTGITNTDVSFIFDEIGANSKKIAVTIHSENENTECYVEIETWDAVSEEATIWVKAPSLPASGDPTVRIYYGVDHADNTTYVGDVLSTPALNVWNSDVSAIYNMAQDPDGDTSESIKNSREDANHGTPAGSMTTADLIDSDIGKAIDFDGTDDRISCGTGIGTALGDGRTNIQIDVSFKADVVTGGLFAFSPLSGANSVCDIHIGGGSILGALNGSNRVTASFSDTSDWHYLSFRYDGTNAKLFLDGSEVATAAYTGSIDLSGINAVIGAYYSTSYTCDAKIGHVRIYNTVQSEAWNKASASAFANTFATFGTEQTAQTYTLAGDVKKGSNSVARNVLLIRDDVPEITATTISDAGDGSFSFTGLAYQGPYTVIFKADAIADVGYRDLIFNNMMGVAE